LGNNNYKEGTKPPPLTPEEQAQLGKDIEAFLGVIPEPEAPGDEWEDRFRTYLMTTTKKS
jgi:hypothetical protein